MLSHKEIEHAENDEELKKDLSFNFYLLLDTTEASTLHLYFVYGGS